MKKYVSVLLTLLLVVSLAACAGQSEVTEDNPSVTDAQLDANEENDEDGQGDDTDSDSELQTTFASYEFQKDAVIEETVLVDEYDVKITATELSYGNYSAELILVIENNSDKDLSFISNSIGYSCNSVNGYMVSEGYLNCDVAAGKKANDSVSIGYDTLMLYGIFEIADIELGFDISDDDYNHTYTGPRTILTSAADDYDYSTLSYRDSIASESSQSVYDYSVLYFSEDAVYEENGLTIASQTLIENEDGESVLLLEVVNDTDEIVEVSTTDIDLNGLRVYDATWSHDTINPGRTAIVDIDLSSALEPEYWEVYGITEVGNVALKVSFTDEDDDEVSETAELSIDIPDVEATLSMEGTEIYNENGIRLISKGVYADPSSYSDDLHILLIGENTSGQTRVLYNVNDSLSVNDYMASYSFYSTTLEDSTCVMIDIRLWGDDLEDINISEPSEIQSVEFSLTIRDENYTKLDEAAVAFTIEE